MIKQITRKEWIEALKSGKYKQGKQALMNKVYPHKKQYCCLGVVCAMSGVSDGDILNSGRLSLEYYGIDVVSLGIEYSLKDNSPAEVLADANDSGKTFEQIADLLIFDSWIRGMEQD